MRPQTHEHRPHALTAEEQAFYEAVLNELDECGLPFLVGGAYALRRYAGIQRNTKDFDIFLCQDVCEAALTRLRLAGFEVEKTFPHWLGKVRCGEYFVDLIYASGNGLARVDEAWFAHAPQGEVWGHRVRLLPPEEMIWSKAFVQERERFDGADVLHLIRGQGARLDWQRLVDLFGTHWRVLLAHLVLFGYVYPNETACIPDWVLKELVGLLCAPEPPAGERERPRLCRGTLLSRAQYLVDVNGWGYEDARGLPGNTMTPGDITLWTKCIQSDGA